MTPSSAVLTFHSQQALATAPFLASRAAPNRAKIADFKPITILANLERSGRRIGRYKIMSDNEFENLPIPCKHCGGRGVFAGKSCEKCGGKGYHLRIPGKPAKRQWQHVMLSLRRPNWDLQQVRANVCFQGLCRTAQPRDDTRVCQIHPLILLRGRFLRRLPAGDPVPSPSILSMSESVAPGAAKTCGICNKEKPVKDSKLLRTCPFSSARDRAAAKLRPLPPRGG
jgi:hypothetical protein